MLGIDLSGELCKGCELYGLDAVPSPGSRVTRFYQCDITDRERVRDAVSSIRPDVVIHSAAWTDVDGCELDRGKAFLVNARGTENVALACRESGAAMIYMSTDFVFDGEKATGPYKEEDPPCPVSVYGASKLEGEKAVQRLLKRYCIVRTSWLFGAHGKNFVDTILKKAQAGEELRVVNDQVGSPTCTADLAKALHALAQKLLAGDAGLWGIYHVTNSGSVSWYDYAREIVRASGLGGVTVAPITSGELARPAKRPRMSVLDNSKFNGATGFRMAHWQDALMGFINERRREVC